MDSSPHIACVVQGNIRRGTDEVLAFLADHFDTLILSTWEADEPNVPSGDFETVLSPPPAHGGFTNRNYQRLSVARGIERAVEAGATHILKWRTDMLPTKLDVKHLMRLAHEEVPAGFSSRIVTCLYRNLTCEPDWFSSIPDYFAFGSTDMMSVLWGMDGLDLSKPMNPPEPMLHLDQPMDDPDWALPKFAPESELYAVFKDRLQQRVDEELTHPQIVRDYLKLISHEELGICWFGPKEGYRPIAVSMRHPWWSHPQLQGQQPKVLPAGYPTVYLQQRLGKLISAAVLRRELALQERWYAAFKGEPIPRRGFTIALGNFALKLWHSV